MPSALIYITISIYHSTLSMWSSSHPIPVVTISILKEKSSSPMSHPFIPVSSVLTAKFIISLIFPISSLTMALVATPHSLIFITVSINLDSKALLFIVVPIAYVTIWHFPFFSPDRSVLPCWSLLNPVNCTMRSIFLCFDIIFLPKLHLWFFESLRRIKLRVWVHVLLLLNAL